MLALEECTTVRVIFWDSCLGTKALLHPLNATQDCVHAGSDYMDSSFLLMKFWGLSTELWQK